MRSSPSETTEDSASQQAVLQSYRARLKVLQGQIVESRQYQFRALMIALGGIFLLADLLYRGGSSHSIFVFLSAVAMVCVLWALRGLFRARGKSLKVAHVCSFYEQGIDRLQQSWRGKGNTGLEFARNHHLYQHDLAIIGDGSLFELLCTTRSQAGADRLASYLLDSTGVEEARARQDAVRELQNETLLREQIASLGKYQFQRCDGPLLADWLALPAIAVGSAVPVFLFGAALVCLVLGLLCLAQVLHWSTVAFLLAPLLAVQAGIALALRRKVRPHLERLLLLANELVVLQQGLALMERRQFRSSKLRLLVENIQAGNARVRLRKLERLTQAVEHSRKDFFYVPSLLLALGTQLTLAVEGWRKRHQNDLIRWLDAWAEFDALNALACYAYEHPSYVFPELLNGPACFEASDLCHPLLPEEGCFGNDIILDRRTQFYLISGSNMAGKSTLLRTIGVNSVLASAGAPVRARSLRTSIFRLCASISIGDSLSEGKSKFLSEVERIRETIRSTDSAEPVLFLIDEILSGTNSKDRRVASELVIKTLIARGAVGVLSTHDLVLTEIAARPETSGVNMHMQSDNPDNPLDFDYRLKAGILRQTNALAIARMAGILV
jgi:hypothetical protein